MSVLNDEGVAPELKLALHERGKNGFIMVNDVVDIVLSPVMQAEFTWVRVHKPTISKHTVL